MNKAFLLILGTLMLLFVACDTGLPRFTPAEGAYVENGGTNRFSFMGGGSQQITVPDGGFAVDTGEEVEEEDAF